MFDTRLRSRFGKLSAALIGVLFFGLQGMNACAQWVQSGGAFGRNVTCLAADDSSIVAGTDSGMVYISKDEGTSWSELTPVLTDTAVTSVLASGGDILAGTAVRGLFRSTNGGATWLKDPGITDIMVTTLAMNAGEVFAGTLNGAYLSSDAGASWTPVDSGLVLPWVFSFAMSGGQVFVLTDAGGICILTWTSSTGIWKRVDPGLGSPAQSFAVYDTDIVAGTPFGVELTGIGGSEWYAADSGLTDEYVLAFAVNGSDLFAATRSGVFLSTNSGTSWSSVSSGLANPYVQCLAVAGGYIFAGTEGNGVWRRPISEMVTAVKEKQESAPSDFSLSQNYPDPFNPATEISYGLPRNGRVAVKVYDILGRLVATLVDGYQSAGVHTVRFSGDNLASGVYFYRLTAPGIDQVRKMILMK